MRSAIDYGCMVYGAAAKTYLNKIDRAINKALRICAGVMRSSPINTIHIEIGEVPIELRRDRMLVQYWSRLQGGGHENPAKAVTQDCWEYATYQGGGFGWIAKAKAEEYRVSDITVISNPISNIPIWLYPEIEVDFNLIEMRREWEEGEIAYKASNYIRDKHYGYLDIYTDGSKDENDKVGTGVYIPSMHINIGKRLTDQISVYSAEMMAIIIGLQWVEEVRPDRVVL